MVKKIENERSLLARRPELSAEWDYEKNYGLRPEDVSVGSNIKVWWKCKRGHSWFATVSNRVKGSNCPYCAGKRPIHGQTDLGTLFPVLAAEFDVKNSNGLMPYDYTAHSGKKVRWCCSAGHKWEARIADRVNGVGCPYCAGIIPVGGKTDLKTMRPDIAKEWDYVANRNINPEDVTEHSGKIMGWICAYGHQWRASINTRAKGHGCPYCAGKIVLAGVNDLEHNNPFLAVEWDTERNEDLMPSQVSKSSNKKVWWKCNRGHVWKATVKNRMHGQQCPYCAGKLSIKGETDFATLHPLLICEWSWPLNKRMHPSDFTEHSKRKVTWQCSMGHIWKATIQSRANGSGCPYCSGNKKHNRICK